MEPLKDCPFCGASQKEGFLFINVIEHTDCVNDSVYECNVSCENCNMVGGPSIIGVDMEITRDIAINLWNKRK